MARADGGRHRRAGGMGLDQLPNGAKYAGAGRATCQPGFSRRAQFGSVGRSARTLIVDGVRWKT